MKRRVPLHDKGTTASGRAIHAVEHDATGYVSRALCGVACVSVQRQDPFGFNPLAVGACRRCALVFWRTVGTSGQPSKRLAVWDR